MGGRQPNTSSYWHKGMWLESKIQHPTIYRPFYYMTAHIYHGHQINPARRPVPHVKVLLHVNGALKDGHVLIYVANC